MLRALLILAVLGELVSAVPIFEYSDVFVKGKDGFQCYRVPALLILKNGNILACVEARNSTPTPDTCLNDGGTTKKFLACRRSFDSGRSWEPIQVLDDIKSNAPAREQAPAVSYEAGYPALVQDSESGTVFALYGQSNGAYVQKSNDNGKTWSAPEYLTKVIPSYALNPAPGHGIQIDAALCGNKTANCPAGRLIVPFECAANSTTYSCALISDTKGETWQLGAVSDQSHSHECEFVQLKSKEGAEIYASERNLGATKGSRFFAVSSNGATSFSKYGQDKTLTEPVTKDWVGVVAGVQRFSVDPSILLFSDPSELTAREKMSIRVSLNEAATWSEPHVIDSGACGYSDLGVINGTTAAVLYERGSALENYDCITFALFNIKWALA